jgi:hypothetical protein
MADHEPPFLKDAGTRVKGPAPRKCAAYRQRAGAEEMRSLPLYRSEPDLADRHRPFGCSWVAFAAQKPSPCWRATRSNRRDTTAEHRRALANLANGRAGRSGPVGARDHQWQGSCHHSHTDPNALRCFDDSRALPPRRQCRATEQILQSRARRLPHADKAPCL